MCGYIVFYNKNKHLEHFVERRWNLTADELKQLLLVTQVTLNLPVEPYNDDEEANDEASTSTDTSRDQAIAESCEHDKTRSEK